MLPQVVRDCLLLKSCLSIFVVLNAEPLERMKIECHCNQYVKNIRPILDDWAIRFYREYPYFYVYQKETKYNLLPEQDPEAIVLFAEKNGKKIGTLRANCLDSHYLAYDLYTPYSALDQLKETGVLLEKTLYVSSFLIVPEERHNKKVAKHLFKRVVELAQEMGKTHVCFMQVVPDLTRMPENYISIEPWPELDMMFKSTGVTFEITWPTLQVDGTVKKQAHTLELFITAI